MLTSAAETIARLAKGAAIGAAAFITGGVFYTLIGFDPPDWFKDSILYVLTLGD